MSNNVVKLNSDLIKFRFFDEDDEEITSFKINPTDIGLMERCEYVMEAFENAGEKYRTMQSVKEIVEFNEYLEEKINYLLGRKKENSVFVPPMTATTVMGDGRIFSEVILDKVLEVLEPEIKKRSRKMTDRVNQYTDKYTGAKK